MKQSTTSEVKTMCFKELFDNDALIWIVLIIVVLMCCCNK